MVPKSKQTESVSTEYLRQARIVWRELISIAKKLPKSRTLTETQNRLYTIRPASLVEMRGEKQDETEPARFFFPCRLRFSMPAAAIAF